MELEQMQDLSDLSGYSLDYLQNLDEDVLWDLWTDVTTNWI